MVDPIPEEVPPQETEYQCQTDPGDKVPFTCNVVFPPAHIGEFPEAETGSFGVVVTLICVLTHVE